MLSKLYRWMARMGSGNGEGRRDEITEDLIGTLLRTSYFSRASYLPIGRIQMLR